MGGICDYEGSPYRTEFWEGQGREYEDRAERIALRKLLPAGGEALVEVGAGFGRLAGLYGGFRRVVLVDYSRSLLMEARQRWGGDGRFTFVAADLRQLPFLGGVADAMVSVRVLHHVGDVPAALVEVARVLAPGGRYVLEFANKRNLKEISRWLAGRSERAPFSPEPVEFVELNYNFHPAYIDRALEAASLQVERRLSVSLFRVGFLKRRFPGALALADGWLQGVTAPLTPGPSVFIRARKEGGPTGTKALFGCPSCKAPLDEAPELLSCPGCGRTWCAEDGIYDLR